MPRTVLTKPQWVDDLPATVKPGDDEVRRVKAVLAVVMSNPGRWAMVAHADTRNSGGALVRRIRAGEYGPEFTQLLMTTRKTGATKYGVFARRDLQEDVVDAEIVDETLGGTEPAATYTEVQPPPPVDPVDAGHIGYLQGEHDRQCEARWIGDAMHWSQCQCVIRATITDTPPPRPVRAPGRPRKVEPAPTPEPLLAEAILDAQPATHVDPKAQIAAIIQRRGEMYAICKCSHSLRRHPLEDGERLCVVGVCGCEQFRLREENESA
jgi:hypothetical protein